MSGKSEPDASSKSVRVLRADGEATYNRILDAAGELVAASGFAETTNKAIAAEARVDLASINYHFGSRSGLYEALLAEAHDRFITLEQLKQLAAAELSARDKLKKLIESMLLRAAGQGGWHARVLGREVLSPSTHLRTLEQRVILPKFQFVLAILSDITGISAQDPALLRCLVCVAAPCAVLIVGRGATALAPVFAMSHEVLLEHLYTFAIAGLEAVGRANAADKQVLSP